VEQKALLLQAALGQMEDRNEKPGSGIHAATLAAVEGPAS